MGFSRWPIGMLESAILCRKKQNHRIYQVIERLKYSFFSLNAHSSRSHTMLMVRIERRPCSLTSSTHSTNEKSLKGRSFMAHSLSQGTSINRRVVQSQSFDEEQALVTATLYLVDLAGSERVKKSRA